MRWLRAAERAGQDDERRPNGDVFFGESSLDCNVWQFTSDTCAHTEDGLKPKPGVDESRTAVLLHDGKANSQEIVHSE